MRSYGYIMAAAAGLLAGCGTAPRECANGVASPDGGVSAKIETLGCGRLAYVVSLDGKAVIEASPLGVTVNGVDTGKGVKLGAPVRSTFKEKYKVLGVHAEAVNHYNGATWPVIGADGKEIAKLETRAFDDGFAYRWVIGGEGAKKIAGESNGWRVKDDDTCWYQTNVGCYEGELYETTAKQTPAGKTIGLPITVRASDRSYWLMLTEANLFEYSDMAVKKCGKTGVMGAHFHADAKGFELQGKVETPWRVTLAVRDLNTLANSDIVKNLCPAPTCAKSVELAKPGRCVWQWLSSGDPVLGEQQWWYDRTKELGFEYYLVDDGWRNWREGDKDQWACLKKWIEYGNKIGVKTAVWVNSNEVATPETRKAYLKRIKDMGAAGIKIDFMPPANVKWTRWYEETRRDTAEIGLFVDFHGAVKPTGRERTWPHELTSEAVRGQEWHIRRYKRIQKPIYDTVLPFWRNVQGPSDYTPTYFNAEELTGYSWAHEMAKAICFNSAFLCYGDNPKYYLANPELEFFKAIPTTWDETVVLEQSDPGKVAAIAKRKGGEWFLGALNGAYDMDVEISLDFLGEGEWKMRSLSDDFKKLDNWKAEDRKVKKGDKVKMVMRAQGGFAARITK